MMKILAWDKQSPREFDQRALEEALNYPVVWIDLVGPSELELQLIQERFNLHPLAVEDVIHKGQSPKVDDYSGYLFTVLHSMKYAERKTLIEEIFLFVSDRWLISIHNDNKQINEAFTRMLKTITPSTQVRGPDFIYYFLIDRIVDDYSTILNEVEENIAGLEGQVEENPTKEMLHEMDSLRRDLITIRRSIWPSLKLVGDILRGIYPLVSDQNMVYFRDIRDHLTQLIDLIEVYHGRVNSVGQLYLASVAASTNQIMKVFTVLATIFLPPTLIASIYGMNFAHMPELHWEIGYPLSLMLMFLVSVIPLIYLKKKGAI